MAKATPITDTIPADPAAAQDIPMPAVVAVKAPAPVKVEKADLGALLTASLDEGKTAFVIGNAVRVDN